MPDGLHLGRGHAAVALDEQVVGELEVGLGRRRARVVVDGVQVVEGHHHEVQRVAAQQDLLLHRHHHQVVELKEFTNRFCRGICILYQLMKIYCILQFTCCCKRASHRREVSRRRPSYLVHALRVEPHDGGVRELVEDHPEHAGAVERLVLQEELLDETTVQHRRSDVVQHCGGKRGCVNMVGMWR